MKTDIDDLEEKIKEFYKMYSRFCYVDYYYGPEEAEKDRLEREVKSKCGEELSEEEIKKKLSEIGIKGVGI